MRNLTKAYIMNAIKKLLFTLSLIAAYVSVKIGAQTGEHFTTASTASEYFTTASTASSVPDHLPFSGHWSQFPDNPEEFRTVGNPINDASLSGEYFTSASTASSDLPGCGGTHTSLSGTISSPNYPSNYNNSLNCSYYIQLSPANSVNITFTSFDTEPGYDYLQVICLSDPSKSVPKFYGTDTPPFLSINPCSTVQLMFYTDGDVTGQGFSLRYSIGNGTQGGLTMTPVNAYVSKNSPEPIVLSCSSRANHPDAYPWWSFSTDRTKEYFRVITSPSCSVLASFDNPMYFSTATQYSTRTCNLTIWPSYINSSAGIYFCTDATLDYAVALVTYIGPSFTGIHFRSLVPEGGYQISLICGVQFFQTTENYYLQLEPSIDIYSADNLHSTAVSNTTASINFSAPPEVLPSYVCNINFTISGGSLSSKYATNQPQNISLTIPSQQVLYCQKDNSSLVIVGVVLGIVVLLLLVVAIVLIVLLRRMKHSATSATTDANYDYIDSVTRTDADPAKPHVYQLTPRETLDVGQGRAVATSSNKDVAPMYDRITSQIYDTEIRAQDKSQTYDTEIHAQDKSQPYLGLYE